MPCGLTFLRRGYIVSNGMQPLASWTIACFCIPLPLEVYQGVEQKPFAAGTSKMCRAWIVIDDFGRCAHAFTGALHRRGVTSLRASPQCWNAQTKKPKNGSALICQISYCPISE